jgi:hypothetical protein
MNLYECVELNISALLRLKNYYQFYPQLDKGYSCLLYLTLTFQLFTFEKHTENMKFLLFSVLAVLGNHFIFLFYLFSILFESRQFSILRWFDLLTKNPFTH